MVAESGLEHGVLSQPQTVLVKGGGRKGPTAQDTVPSAAVVLYSNVSQPRDRSQICRRALSFC